MDYIAYILVGFFTGILSGLLGIGGGVIMVPALVAIFHFDAFSDLYLMQLATGTSLAAMIITTLATTRAHQKRGNVQWRLLKFLIPGTVIGALSGVWLGKEINTHILQLGFAIFALVLGSKLLLSRQKKPHSIAAYSHPLLLFIFALGIGLLSGLLGIGGGILIIPLLLVLGVSMLQASATSAACAFPTACAGAVSAMIAGWQIEGLPPLSLGFVYWPVALLLGIVSIIGAPLGVRLAHKLPVQTVKRLFGLMLCGVAIKMGHDPLLLQLSHLSL